MRAIALVAGVVAGTFLLASCALLRVPGRIIRTVIAPLTEAETAAQEGFVALKVRDAVASPAAGETPDATRRDDDEARHEWR